MNWTMTIINILVFYFKIKFTLKVQYVPGTSYTTALEKYSSKNKSNTNNCSWNTSS